MSSNWGGSLPVSRAGVQRGALCVMFDRVHQFSASEMGAFAGYAQLAGIGLRMAEMSRENEQLMGRLTHLSTTDALTGAVNRRHGEHLLEQPEWKGRIEALPLPLFEQFYFMVVSKPYYAQNGAAVDAMWDAIARLNEAAKTQKK